MDLMQYTHPALSKQLEALCSELGIFFSSPLQLTSFMSSQFRCANQDCSLKIIWLFSQIRLQLAPTALESQSPWKLPN